MDTRITPWAIINHRSDQSRAAQQSSFAASSDTHQQADGRNDGELDKEAATDADAESILSSFLPHLFPDDTPVCLGDPGQALSYASPEFGNLKVWVPDYGKTGAADGEGNGAGQERLADGGGSVESCRTLFAHYLWGGALVIADEIERRYRVKQGLISTEEGSLGNAREEGLWDVAGQDVLELGAGAALPSMIALRCGAKSIHITDHPSAGGLYGPIQQTLAASVPSSLHQNVSIQPYTWGTFPDASEGTDGGEGRAKELAFAASGKSRYTRVICADCLWMPGQHDNLAQSIAWFLAPPPSVAPSKRRAAEARDDGKDCSTSSGGAAYVVAGFHTGREIVASFFANAVPKAGLLVERIYERDLHAKPEDGRVIQGVAAREAWGE